MIDFSKLQNFDFGYTNQRNPNWKNTEATADTSYYNSPDVTGEFKSPKGWTQAQDWWTKMLGGQGLAGGGVDWSGPNAQVTDISKWWEAQKPIYATQSQDAMKQAMEQMGFNLGEGMRWSTPAQRTIADVQQRSLQDLMGQVMGAQMTMEEANKARALQAALTSGQLGTQASIANMGARNQAAENLFGAGSAENQLALQIAQMLSGFGQQTENPAWMQNMMGTYPQGATGLPKTYTPSFWDYLSQADFSGLAGLGGGGGQPLTQTGYGRNTGSWQQPNPSWY